MLKYLLIASLLLAGCKTPMSVKQKPDLPKIWMTYKGDNPEKEIPDLKARGVGAISVRMPDDKILELVRENDMKLILSMGEVVYLPLHVPGYLSGDRDAVEKEVIINYITEK
jgi:hypothetical protein